MERGGRRVTVRILDATAGNRAIWHDKMNPSAVFIDVRAEGHPLNLTMDARHTTFPDSHFDLVVFDPPHMACGPQSVMAARYGRYLTDDIRLLVPQAFREFHRILRPDGLVAFKWNDHDTKLDAILKHVEGFERLFGHSVSVRTKHSSQTFWVMLRRVGL